MTKAMHTWINGYMDKCTNGEIITRKHLMLEAGITMDMISEQTLSRFLNKQGSGFICKHVRKACYPDRT